MSMPEHRIRLNRAWEVRAVPVEFCFQHDAAPALLGAPVDERFDLPLAVDGEPAGEDGEAVRLLLTRWFNGPSNLAPGQSVQLVVEPAELAKALRLNGAELLVEPASCRSVTGETPVPPAAFDLTGKLQRHNRLDILVGVPLALSQASIALAIADDGSAPDFDRFAAAREPPP
jgi:hypothetical protein